MLLTSRWGRRRCGQEQGAAIPAEDEVAPGCRHRVLPTAWRTPALLSLQGGLSFRSERGGEGQGGAGLLEPTEIADLATQGNSACEATLHRYEERLARALGQVINVLDPDAIVLGGGLSNLARLYENVPKLWAPYLFTDRVSTRFLKNRHGDSSGVRDAAWL